MVAAGIGLGGTSDPMFSLHVVFTVLVALSGWMLLLQLLERIPEEELDTFRPPVGLGVVFTVLAVAMLVLDLVFRLDTAVGVPPGESLVGAVAAWPPLNWGGPVVMVLGAVLVAVFGRNHHLD